MEKDYWEDYYKQNRILLEPSLFAKHSLKHYIKPRSRLVELGCGNGRDAIFFAYNNVKVLAVDQCEQELEYLKLINKHDNLTLSCGDFTDLGPIGPFDFVYSRFTWHSVSEKGEDKTISWVYDNLENGGMLLIEARSKNNELYGLGSPVQGEPDAFIYDNHFRRFIDTAKLKEKLEKKGFEIISFEEKNGFGGSTNQRFFRQIAIKN